MLENKWIIITGAGSGIGKQTCLELINYGANLVCIDKSLAELKKGESEANS